MGMPVLDRVETTDTRSDIARPRKTLVLLAHSAAGKSAILKGIGADRSKYDMDVFCLRSGLPACVERLLEMTAVPGGIRMIVMSNAISLLDQVQREKQRGEPRLASFLFCYLRRPRRVVYENLCLVNTDGHRHSFVEKADYDCLYEEFDQRFRAIADFELDYAGTDIGDLCDFIDPVASCGYQVARDERSDEPLAELPPQPGLQPMEPMLCWYERSFVSATVQAGA